MSSPLLTSALLTALATSATAQAQPFSGTSGSVRVQAGSGFATGPGERRDPRRDRILLYGYGYGSPEAWAYFNNRSFAPDSYNDWWHDRPDRSYPRWMSRNEGCQRVWWSGGGWRC